jgi:hypothetical protein
LPDAVRAGWARIGRPFGVSVSWNDDGVSPLSKRKGLPRWRGVELLDAQDRGEPGTRRVRRRRLDTWEERGVAPGGAEGRYEDAERRFAPTDAEEDGEGEEE